MTFYEEQERFSEEEPRTTVYHAGNGFYNPYIEPLWKKEKRLIRSAGNGIGFAALGYIMLSLLAGVIYEFLILFLYPSSEIHGLLYVTETTEWLFTFINYLFVLLIPFGLYALCIKIPFKVAVPIKRAKADLTFCGVLIGLGVGVIASYASSYLQYGLAAVGVGITMPEYEIPETIPGIILYVLSVAVAPAFIEEIVFRGIVMQSLRRFGDMFAIVASAFAFGVFHMNLIQIPYSFIYGLCIGYLVIRTGSLWVGIIMHFVNNGSAVIMEYAFAGMSYESMYLVNSVYNLVCVILSVAAIIYVVLKYKDIFRFEPSRSVLSSWQKAGYFISSPGFILAFSAAIIVTAEYIYFF